MYAAAFPTSKLRDAKLQRLSCLQCMRAGSGQQFLNGIAVHAHLIHVAVPELLFFFWQSLIQPPADDVLNTCGRTPRCRRDTCDMSHNHIAWTDNHSMSLIGLMLQWWDWYG